MKPQTLDRSFWQRLRGQPATSPPHDPSCWTSTGHRVHLDLKRAPELREPGGAIRLEGAGLPSSLLVVHGDDGCYHAFCGRCTHNGRPLDPVPGTGTVQCCSLGTSTFDYAGRPLYGPAEHVLPIFPLRLDGSILTIVVR